MNDTPIFQPSIDNLSIVVEEGARASKRNIKRFIEPAKGTLGRATSKRHHLIFGRRGSGKSSLLLKAGDTLESQGHPIAFVDLEPFKGHHYPDVLISVLSATFTKFEEWLSEHFPDGGSKKKWYEKIPLWPKSKKRADRIALLVAIKKCIQTLEAQLFLPDNANLITTSKDNSSTEQMGRTKGLAEAKSVAVKASVEEELAAKMTEQKNLEVREETKRSKQDFLYRSIPQFQEIFRQLSDSTSYSGFLFLDDLYHLHKRDQPYVLDYFHRVAKNNDLWIKVGTIKNRSSWYLHGPQPIGLKIGDDADDINLDLTLEKFPSSREFLVKILQSYAADAHAPNIDEFVSGGGIDRLVIASGGVTRDFLGIFRRSIDEARERLSRNPEHGRGPKIGAEDVNVASGNYGDTKKEEFRRDTLEDREKLETVFEKVGVFCLDRNKANVFLIDQDAHGAEHQLIQELIDLRLVHHVKSRVTVGNKPGKLYRALLLDISQYTGERRRKGIDMVEFWHPDKKDVLRRPQYILDPTINVDGLREEIGKRKAARKNPSDRTGDPSGQLNIRFKAESCE